MENIPADGGALIVANHSGTMPLDALMTRSRCTTTIPHRHLRMLAADLVFTHAVRRAELARKAGATLACNEDAERLLTPASWSACGRRASRGSASRSRERYKLQRFGRGGFVSAALRSGVPIIPCSIVGAEEIYPLVGNIPRWPGCSACPTSRSRRSSRCSARSA